MIPKHKIEALPNTLPGQRLADQNYAKMGEINLSRADLRQSPRRFENGIPFGGIQRGGAPPLAPFAR